jgi:hypothetical protein
LMGSARGTELKEDLRRALQPVQSCGLYGVKVNIFDGQLLGRLLLTICRI